ncbi:MAG: class I SAM-dependent methyltransferase [Fibromonadales bacterium]|nr:class I SAM-dependent methyltransferase [Fibromonadales bacterium]
MQERHKNDALYFQELAQGINDYVIPYIESVKAIPKDSVVMEVGCGFGGNLYPFLERGHKVIGIDKNDYSIGFAKELFKDSKYIDKLTLLNEDFYKVDPGSIPKANIVVIRDALEHIVNREMFFERLKEFLADDAIIFNAFPPWRMPFGGHQQGCKSKLLSKMPWFHLLPCVIFDTILRVFGEDEKYIKGLRSEVRATKLSICKYKQLLKKVGFKIEKETWYLINPSYKIKFGLNPRVLPCIMRIPHICDFYTTTHYSVICR